MAVLIISNGNDSTVDRVIDWLNYSKVNFIRVNIVQLFKEHKFTKTISGQSLGLLPPHFKSIWFRNAPLYYVNFNSEKNILNKIINFTNFEFFSICLATLNDSGKVFQLSRYDTKFLNKFTVLKLAQSLGILVPESILTNSKEDLKEFKYLFPSIISKSVGENIFFSAEGRYYAQYTKDIDNEYVESLPNFVLPTFFQRKVDKEFDVRIFFIEDQWFSIAVFSDSLDMREDYHNHRYIPLKLPIDILNKLKELVKTLNLNTGSIDMIREKFTSNFYFLEINPNGQIGPFAKTCNIQLEKLIASKLAFYHEQ